MDQQQQPDVPRAAPVRASKMRMVAIVITAVALLVISIPFVFEAHPESKATLLMTPHTGAER